MMTSQDAVTDYCQWFALCPNEATTARSHPILVSVPCCERCAARVDKMSQ